MSFFLKDWRQTQYAKQSYNLFLILGNALITEDDSFYK